MWVRGVRRVRGERRVEGWGGSHHADAKGREGEGGKRCGMCYKTNNVLLWNARETGGGVCRGT